MISKPLPGQTGGEPKERRHSAVWRKLLGGSEGIRSGWTDWLETTERSPMPVMNTKHDFITFSR